MEVFSIENHLLKASFKRKGAELCSVVSKQGKEFIWQGGEIWPRHAPNLFPVIGSLIDHQYIYNGTTYDLAHHGFARNLDFDMLHQSEHSICFVLTSRTETIQRFPFQFTLLITYTLEENSLNQRFRVINDGDKALPMSIGGHPAFNVSNHQAYHILFEKEETVRCNTLEGPFIAENTIDVIEGNKIPLTPNTFDNDALIFQNLESDWVGLVHNSGSHKIIVDISEFPFLGIWAKPNAGFVCIEPWQGMADLVNHNKEIKDKKGIVWVERGAERIQSFTMAFSE